MTFHCSGTDHFDAGRTAQEIVGSSRPSFDCWRAPTEFIYAVGNTGKSTLQFYMLKP